MDRISAPPPLALSIAGHDPGGGAGVTADLLVFGAHGLHGLSAITSLTVQSTLGVAAVEPVSSPLLRQVLGHLHADTPPDGIKIGMLGSAENAGTVALYLHERSLSGTGNSQIPIVLDPVLRSSSGADLLAGGLAALRLELLPQVGWVTPNWGELAALAEAPVTSPAEAEAAAHRLARHYPRLHIVVTGGDQPEPTDLLRLPDGTVHRFAGEHIATRATHGTGCAFSSALLSRLLLGDDPVAAVRAAKNFVTQAIRRAAGIGQGNGPLQLLWPRQRGPNK